MQEIDFLNRIYDYLKSTFLLIKISKISINNLMNYKKNE